MRWVWMKVWTEKEVGDWAGENIERRTSECKKRCETFRLNPLVTSARSLGDLPTQRGTETRACVLAGYRHPRRARPRAGQAAPLGRAR